MKKNAYIYPISGRNNKGAYNPYLANFMESLSTDFKFVNEDDPSNIGLVNIMKYINKIDAVFFHWPENIIERKYGLIQTMFLLGPLLIYMKIRGIEIIYTVHNRISHSKKNFYFKKKIAHKLMKGDNFFITHAKEGVEFINKIASKKNNVFYFPHPVDLPLIPDKSYQKEIDILIWGSINPYKGIYQFIEWINQYKPQNDWKILITGKVSSEKYYNDLVQIKKKNTEIVNAFLDDEEIEKLISKSRIVLFPYESESVISSGAFAKTLAFKTNSVGPDCGSFLDYKTLENIHIFKTPQELIQILSDILIEKAEFQHSSFNQNILSKTSWEIFASEFMKFYFRKRSNSFN